MSPGSRSTPPTPAAAAVANRLSSAIGAAVREARSRRRWTARDVAVRARVSVATVTNVEAGRTASLHTYARLMTALGLSIDLVVGTRRRSVERHSTDVVHAAMGEWAAARLAARGYEVAIDHPYQHYQFAGRADVLAWTTDPAVLLHIENRTRFPDLQAAIGSYNAKRRFLAATVAQHVGIRRFDSETHVLAGLWSAEVLHAVRLRRATFRAVCPDPPDALAAWLDGARPDRASSSSFVLLDPSASGRQASFTGLEHALDHARPRSRGYAEAARQLGAVTRERET